MSSETRHEHPYHMHDAILAQPDAFARAADRGEKVAEDFADGISGCRRLFLVGIGTSHHAAQVGEHLFRAYGGGIDVRAVHSFDFALYGPELSPDDAVVAVSHRGTKRYTTLALERALAAGCKTALITGEGGDRVATDAVFRTTAQEASSAHTVSFTGAVATLALLAGKLGHGRTGSPTLEVDLLAQEIPDALRGALELGDEAATLARENVGRRRIWLVGGGPGEITAAEVSLKIKETSYLQPEGMPTETMLHGPFQCVEAEDLFVLIAPSGPARERTLEVGALADAVGAPCLVVADDASAREVPAHAAAGLVVPSVPEPFSALTCLVPLQLFSYHLALARGTNPDNFRADDPRFARADVTGRL